MDETPNPYAKTYDDVDPEIQIRTDLWGEMQLPQLINQRDMLLSRLQSLQSLISPSSSPTILNMYNAMQMGLSDINGLVDSRSNTKQKKK